MDVPFVFAAEGQLGAAPLVVAKVAHALEL